MATSEPSAASSCISTARPSGWWHKWSSAVHALPRTGDGAGGASPSAGAAGGVTSGVRACTAPSCESFTAAA
eukprot:7341585-Prymnesium_polylepis.1